jgi:Saccharopine dehydrogenase NADP binding domain
VSENVVIMGAGGASGQRIARLLAARGIQLMLAGRHHASLAPLAEELGAGHIEADIARPELVLKGARMMVNTAGPFASFAAPAAKECLAAGIPYLDIANELSAAGQLLGLADQAFANGTVAVTGAGFGPAVTESLLLQLMTGHAGTPAAVRVAVAPAAEGVSPGVQATVALAVAEGAAWYAGGVLHREPLGAGAANVRLGGHTWQVLPAPVGDLAAARRASGAPDIIAYFAVPGQRPATGQTSYAYAEIQDHDGGKKACMASLGIGLDVTAAIAAETACRILAGNLGAGPGAWTPGALYGPGLVSSACDINVRPADPDTVWVAGAAQ